MDGLAAEPTPERTPAAMMADSGGAGAAAANALLQFHLGEVAARDAQIATTTATQTRDVGDDGWGASRPTATQTRDVGDDGWAASRPLQRTRPAPRTGDDGWGVPGAATNQDCYEYTLEFTQWEHDSKETDLLVPGWFRGPPDEFAGFVFDEAYRVATLPGGWAELTRFVQGLLPEGPDDPGCFWWGKYLCPLRDPKPTRLERLRRRAAFGLLNTASGPEYMNAQGDVRLEFPEDDDPDGDDSHPDMPRHPHTLMAERWLATLHMLYDVLEEVIGPRPPRGGPRFGPRGPDDSIGWTTGQRRSSRRWCWDY
jgi:hypothetical protein